MQKTKTWILVANSSCAKIFSIEKVGILKEIEIFEHPESQLRNRDLVSDKPGRVFKHSGASASHAFETHMSRQRQEASHFADELANHLEKEREVGTFDKLYISASPFFLSLLRQKIRSHTAQVLIESLNKDMTHMKQDEIWAHISQGRF